MKMVGMRPSPPVGVLKSTWASLFCAVAVKHEFSTMSSADFIVLASTHPRLSGCDGESLRAWQHSGKGYWLAATAPAASTLEAELCGEAVLAKGGFLRKSACSVI